MQLVAAIKAETLNADAKGSLKLPTKICAVSKETEEEDENMLDDINAIRIQNGKQPFKKFPLKFPKFNGNGNSN